MGRGKYPPSPYLKAYLPEWMGLDTDMKRECFYNSLDNDRPWLVGFSGGKDSTMLASLIFDAVLSASDAKRKKPISIL